MHISPTIRDASRAVARLDEHASADPGDVVDIDGTNWTGLDLRISAAQSLAHVARHTVKLPQVTRRDAGLMMAAHGASPFTVRRHARAVASLIRADFARHTMGGVI